MTKNVLVTGFVPFGEHLTNPSSDVLTLLKKHNITTLALPVSFQASFIFLKNFIDTHPISFTHIIHLGLASDRSLLTIEKIAINYMNTASPDNDGNAPLNQMIDSSEEAPDGIFSSIDPEFMLSIARKLNIPAAVSFHAGTYVCNYLFYESLRNFSDKKISFIHIPKASKLNLEEVSNFLITIQDELL